MNRFKLAHPQNVTIERKELSVEDVIDDIRKIFQTGETLTLDSFLEVSKTLPHLLVSFLTVLDLIRMGEVRLTQIDDMIYLKGA